MNSVPGPSARVVAVQTPVIPVVAALIRSQPGTISLGQGVVSYGPPESAAAEMRRFWEDPNQHKYQAVEGIAELRDTLAAKLAAENGIRVGAERALVVTAGGNMAFMNAVLAVANPGDEVILQTPYYFNHEMAIVMAGCQAVCVDTDREFQLRPEAIRRALTPRTRAVVTVSPNNPTGAVYPEAALREVNRLCREAGIFHIHDEAYEYFTYDGVPHFSPGSIEDAAGHTLCLFSLSKAYGFASWRIGYMIAPESLLVSIRKIQDTILICPPVVSQFAAIGALRAGRRYCQDRLEPLARVRGVFREELGALGESCEVPPAQGAFYFWLRLASAQEPMQIVERLVAEHRVAAIPGTAFGVEGSCALRVSYGALEPATAIEGVRRLVKGLREILGH